MLSVGDPWPSSTRTKRYWKVGEETSQYTGDTCVSVEEGPGADEVALNPRAHREVGCIWNQAIDLPGGPCRNGKPDAVGHTDQR